MKQRVSLLVLAVLAFVAVQARTLSQQEAQAVATQWFSHNSSLRAKAEGAAALHLAGVETNARGEASYYVFNRGERAGYVIVAGDDAATAVLGYSTEGEFSKADVPANVQWWLSQYAAQIEYLRSHPEAARRPLALSTSVEPLMTTTWKQSAPYNEEIPTFRTSLGTKRPLVGCVATAMAQMMKAHNWPTTGEGSHSYVAKPTSATESKTLSANFGSTTYDWANMKNSYGSSNSATAAATLCYHAGVAVDMQYNFAEDGGSGAQIYDAMKALRNYFRYDKSLDLYLRDFYTTEVWEQMLRADLDEGLPIIYGGSTSTMYGHCFVFDGYDTEGKFHINWGWGGDYDGYFVSSVLNTGRNNMDFSNWQQAILGARPDRDGTSTGSLRPLTGYLVDFETTATQANVGSDVGLTVEGITLLGEGTFDTYYCGVQILTEDESTQIGAIQYQADLGSYEGFRIGSTYALDEAAAITVPADIVEGVYHVYCVYVLDYYGDETPIRYERPAERGKYIRMEVKNGIAYFSEGEVGPVVTKPTITVQPRQLAFTGAPGKSYNKTLVVKGTNLEGDITATLSGNDASLFTISATTIAKATAETGTEITVTWAPTALGTSAATLTLATEGGTDVTVALTGTAQDETPTLAVTPAELAMTAKVGATATATFEVSGNFIASDVTLTLAGDDAFSLSAATIAAEDLADATATVTVTYAPAAAGSHSATVTLATEGAQPVTVTLAGTATEKPDISGGTATDAYLDIRNHATIGEASAVPADMSAIYKYTEYPDDDVAWLTLSAYGAWQTTADQKWLNIDASYTYTTRWSANAANHMLGYETYFTSGSRVLDSNSTSTFYVTNCTRAVAYGHSYSFSNLATFTVTECEVNGEDITEKQVIETLQCSSYAEFLLTTSALDPSKIYKIQLVAYSDEVYEFGFETTLKQEPAVEELTLAQLVATGAEGKEYKIADGDLRAVYLSHDAKTLYCKDNNGYADKDEIASGQIDFLRDVAKLQTADWDQSNWLALYNAEGWSGDILSLNGYLLSGVSGTLTSLTNPTLTTSAAPTATGEQQQYTPNVFIPCNFDGADSQINVKDKDYFFVAPKPLEVVTVEWAMWNGSKFTIPSTNKEGLNGEFFVNASMYEGGQFPALTAGDVYSFTALVKRETAQASTLKALTTAATNGYVVYPLKDLKNDTPTAIATVDGNAPVEVARYNVAGQPVGPGATGIIIVLMSDGTARKLIAR